MSQTESATDVGTRFLEALSGRDYDALGACFAADGTLRGVVPPGLREADGREAIVERFQMWTDDIEEYEIVDNEAAPFAEPAPPPLGRAGRRPGARAERLRADSLRRGRRR